MASGNIRGCAPVEASTKSYSALAPIYDRVMEHVEYDQWFDLIQRILVRYCDASRPRLLEVGGGTGMLGAMLHAEGYSFCGSDLSFAMCSRAGKKNLPVFCADARSLPVRGPFDLLFFLYDGINYFLSGDEFETFFHEAAEVLDPGGLLLFDVTTETNSRRYFSNTIDVEDYGDACYIRHSYFDYSKSIQHNDFTIFSRHADSELFEKQYDCHAQRIYSVDEIRSFVPDHLFETVGIWDGYSFKRYSRNSDRIHFLLRKRLSS